MRSLCLHVASMREKERFTALKLDRLNTKYINWTKRLILGVSVALPIESAIEPNIAHIY